MHMSKRVRKLVRRGLGFDFRGIDLDLSPEEILADLRYGVGSLAEKTEIIRKVRTAS